MEAAELAQAIRAAAEMVANLRIGQLPSRVTEGPPFGIHDGTDRQPPQRRLSLPTGFWFNAGVQGSGGVQSMNRLAAAFRRFSEAAVVRLAVGASMVLSGLDDMFEQMGLGEDLMGLDLHHGVMLFAGVQMVKALGDVLDGVTAIGEARKAG